ncbi:MAG: AAA family ATPase [Calditrichaeota bacterium]|nr:AAA family ATPase [Calditrichota bacterium]MBT7616451.1 AAA family ATPase [Calditrichota bacterium]MBT7789408.1 AAA family ATPase [Calditrichota bacterium]
MKRISITGCGGAGKSTLALELERLLGIEVIHLDKFYWNPGWIQTPNDEWDVIHENLLKGDSWIIDGSYARTLDARLKFSDTIIFLDFSRRVCLLRWMKRVITHYGQSRPDLAPECPEKLDWEMARWIWKYPSNHRLRVVRAIENNSKHLTVHILRSPREVKRFLKKMR